MKKLLTRKDTVLIAILLIGVFHLTLVLVAQLSAVIPLNHKFLGEVSLSNFDGVYYVLIAQNGYGAYQQAFFPLFPMLIRVISEVFNISAVASALLIVNVSLFTFLYMLMRFISLDFGKRIVLWTALFYVVFPTSFFLVAVYTESLFLALIISSFYFMRRGNLLVASILGMFAAATRIVGVFLFPVFLLELYLEHRKQKNNKLKLIFKKSLPLLIIPLGTISYMTYLYFKFGDALLFIHVQPAFGAGRSGSQIVLLPQVLWRYFKILTTISHTSFDFYIALLELVIFTASIVALFFAWRRKINFGYIFFSFCVILFPTLSGTLSSMPRYTLAAFAIFIFLGSIQSRALRIFLLILLLTTEGVLAALFMRGYFVS